MAQEPRLADHFPRVEKSCRKVAATFFTCFSEAGRMKDGSVSFLSLKRSYRGFVCSRSKEQYDVLVSPLQDAGAGTRGLESCVREMASYDK